MQIIVFGRASHKTKTFEVNADELELSLLSFLQLKELPIASSCSGKMQCRKCVDSFNNLSCEMRVKDCLNKTIEFDYL